jgi:hypothetical protein
MLYVQVVYYLSNIYINQKQYNIVVDEILYLVRDE